MFKIGDFARLTRVGVKTLRYYDEIGLLKPARTDEASGYRLYSFGQLPRLNRILALKGLGFTLEQVARIMDEGLGPGELEGMLRLRRAELEAGVAEAEVRLKDVAARLYQIQREGKMSEHDVVLKATEPLTVASAREVVRSPERMRERCLALLGEVFRVVEAHKLPSTGTTLALYHGNEGGVDVEMAVMLGGRVPPQQYGDVTVKELPAETVASAVYRGSFNAFDIVGQIHADIGRWVEASGYKIAGPSREIHLQPPEDYRDDGVMELQYPITKTT